MKKIFILLLILFSVSVYAQEEYLVPVRQSELATLKFLSKSFNSYETVCVAENCYFVVDKNVADKLVKDGVADSYEPVTYRDLIMPVATYSVETDDQWALNNELIGWKKAKVNYMDALSPLGVKTGPVIVIIDSGLAQHHDIYGADNQYNIFWQLGTALNGTPIYGYTNKDGLEGTSNAYIHDSTNHGTHVAGILGAATTDDTMGSASYGQAHVIPFQVVTSDDKLSSTDILKSISRIIELKTQDNVSIIAVNMSYGAYGYSSAEDAAMKSLYEAGIIAVVAAGNEGNDIGQKDKYIYPASYNYPNIITVAALKSGGGDSTNPRLDTSYTNYGGTTTIAAPGTGIFSSVALFSGRDVPYDSNPQGIVYQSANALNISAESFSNNDWSVSQQREILCTNSVAGSSYTVANLDVSSLSGYAYKSIAINYQISGCTTMNGCAELVARYDNGNEVVLKSMQNSGEPNQFISRIPDGVQRLTVSVRNTTGNTKVKILNFLVGGSNEADSYELRSGTSMAAPFVTGTLAAGKALYPDITPQQLVTLLYSKADRPLNTAYVDKGRQISLNAFLEAVSVCKSTPANCADIKEYPDRPEIQNASTSVSVSVSRGFSCSMNDRGGINASEILILLGVFAFYIHLRHRCTKRKNTL